MNLNQYSQSVAQPGLSVEKIKRLKLPFAPANEQEKIARYLSTETTLFDKKAQILKKKISKYLDLKKVLINETVCRGLSPNAPRKPSGVAWLGDIPAHWEVRRLKDVGEIVLGKMLNNTRDGAYSLKPYLKSKNISPFNVVKENIELMYFNENEMNSYRLKKDDLLLSEGGEVGKTCIWNDEIEECYIQNSVHKITISKHNNPRYFLYASALMNAVRYYDSIVNQVSIKHLTWDKLVKVPIAVPPLQEQIEIGEYLDQKTQTIDAIVLNLQSQLEKLKELRKALINDVVTGKVRVTD